MHLKSLIAKITHGFGWHQERSLTFASMVLGLIDQRNVQHHALSTSLETKGFLKSKLERIRRFFAKQVINYEEFAYTLVQTVFQKIPQMDLILDRTNWKLGKKDINYLVLAAKVGPVTFPLLWSLLEHQGCSDLEQRKRILERFRATFGFQFIRSFTADREFIGKDWLDYLCINNIPFLSALRIIGLFSGAKTNGL